MLFICYLNWTDQGAKAVKGVAARHENLKTEIAGLRRLPHPNPESDPQKAEAPERRQRVAIKARIGYDVAHIRRLDFDRGRKDR